MTRDDIIRMAKEAWLRRTGCVWTEPKHWSKNELVRFAELISAAEREKVAQWMLQRGYATGHGNTIEDLLQELDWQVQERERESEGARVDASWASCAAAIRAMGSNETLMRHKRYYVSLMTQTMDG